MGSPMFNFYAENQQKVHKATAIKLWFFEEEKMEENEIQKKNDFRLNVPKKKWKYCVSLSIFMIFPNFFILCGPGCR